MMRGLIEVIRGYLVVFIYSVLSSMLSFFVLHFKDFSATIPRSLGVVCQDHGN